MEDPTATQNDVDASPDVVAQKTWDETIQSDGNLSQVGSGLSAVGKPLQSTNFVEGQTGWRINSNGNAEFANVTIRNNAVSVQTFTSSGTWTKPEGLRSVIIEVQAAGGAGGSISGADTGASGGGSGGYAKKYLDADDMDPTETVTIGATTSFTYGANTISCTVGSDGAQGDADGGAGGTATGGDVNIPGQYGWPGAAGVGSEISGAGGNCPLGTGGGAHKPSGNLDGRAAGGYGAGGGGAMRTGASGSQSGGSAGPGIVIVTQFF